MIAYMDASALVKRYVEEAGTEEVSRLISESEVVGTSAVTRVEVAAALSRAKDTGVLTHEDAMLALEAFRSDWESLVRIQTTEMLLSRAEEVAWKQGLNGRDATHLAAAIFWQEMLGDPVAVLTYDRSLWDAAQRVGLVTFPEDRP